MTGTLFIAQTPYHILLSLGMSSPGDKVQIIDDFQDSSYFAKLIEGHESQLAVLGILPGRATTKDTMGQRVRYSQRNIKAMRSLFDLERFSRLVIFNDRTPETQFAAFLARQKNIPLELVEDGLAAYVPSKERPPSAYRGFLSRILFGRYYHNIVTLGTSPYVEVVRTFFPDLIIPSLRDKKLERLDPNLFNKIPPGIVEAMTSQLNPSNECVLVLPHSEILGAGGTDDGSLRAVMQGTAKGALDRYARVAVKYHPRERESYLGEYEGCDTIPKQVPMELVYLKLGGLREVIGPLSTSLYTARIILGDRVKITATSADPSASELMRALSIDQIS